MRHDSRPARSNSFVEVLESRRLLSVTPILVGLPTPLGGTSTPVTVAPVGGLILHEKAGVQFTASLGTFVTIAPATNLHAGISWGDGTSSQGTLKAVGIVGVDEIRFEVDGTHTYANRGAFRIRVTVTQPGPTPTSLVRLVAVLRDRALVTAPAKNVLLDGTISGKYLLAPTAAILGGGYVFNGTGTAGDLGAVTARGLVTLLGAITSPVPVAAPALVTTEQAVGTLTLTQTGPSASAVLNSVTLALTGPAQPAAAGFPATLSFTITGGTGAFAGATGVGTIAATLNSDGTFTFVLTSLVPAVQ